MMLHTMIELIHTLLYIRTKRLLCFLYLQLILGNILKNMLKIKNTPPSNESSDAKPNGIKLKDGVYLATTSAAAELCDNHDAPCYTMLCRYKSFPTAPMSCTMHPVVTNLLQEIDDGMESRTTPIQEGEDDEDIEMLDTFMPWPSPSYKSSPTRSSRSFSI